MPRDTPFIFLADHEYGVADKFVPVDLESQGWVVRTSLMQEIVSDSIGKRDDEWMCHCSLAYILSGKGARKLLEYLSKHGFRRASDYFLKDFAVSQNRNHASIRCLATSSSDIFGSEVWNNRSGYTFDAVVYAPTF